MTWDETIRDLSGEWDDPRQVIEFDLAAGTCRDVTRAAFAAAALRYRDRMGADWPHSLVDNMQTC
jgi:hypothetical protein